MSFETVVQITEDLRGDYPQNPAWNDSPFNWIKCLPPGSKGVVGRAIGSGILQAYGFTVMARKTQLRVNSQGIEVRTALMWEEGIIKFQNIRDGNFDHVLCLGLAPNEAFAWLIPKQQIWKDGVIQTSVRGITAQHKGADAWVSVNLNQPELWLRQYGGTVQQMIAVAQTQL